MHDLAEVEALIGGEQREMHRDIEKCAHAKHAAHIDQVAVARDAAERRHCQGQPEKHQRPETGAMDQVVERTRAVDDIAGIKKRFGYRQQQQRQRSHAQG